MDAFPPERQPNSPLPVPLTSLVGREHEIAEVCDQLRSSDVRLLALTGPGGVGKTRLACAVAAVAGTSFANGLRYIPLAAVQDHRLIAEVLAQAVGVRDPSDRPFLEQVKMAASGFEALLLVDNFEHLLPAAPLLTDLLAACPRVKILVTSRERLRLSGEYDLTVHPLAYPEPERLPTLDQIADSPAVRLFVERAQALDPTFSLMVENATAVAAICHRLDGLPLAIELAAARSPHLSPASLLARLAHRLPLLTSGPRDVPERLQTMRDAIDWSYGLLSPVEQTLLNRIAIFAGGFKLEAAEAVTAMPSVLCGISALVDKSLVRRIDQTVLGHGGSESRYEMLETIRDFGLERLAGAEEVDVRSAHASFFHELVEDAVMPGADEATKFDQLDAELPNLRVALSWTCANASSGTALRLSARFGDYCLRRGHHREGRDWLERALAIAPDEEPTFRSTALNAYGDLLRELGEHSEAERTYTLALKLSEATGNRKDEATALSGLAALTDDMGDSVAQKSLCESSAAIWRELGDRRGLARALHTLGWAEAGLGNIAQAHEMFQESLDHARAAGDVRGIAHILDSLGMLHVEQGEFRAALPYLMESLVVARAARDRSEIAEITSDLGWLTLELGDIAAARTYLAECVALLGDSGRRRIAVFALEACAVLAEGEGHHIVAAKLITATTALRDEMGVPIGVDPRVVAANHSRSIQVLKRIARDPSNAIAVWSMEQAFREAAAIASPPVLSSSTERDPDGVNDPATRSGLTPRQIDVLRLVVSGRTDSAIADALFISRRTASRHVGAILAKLDVSSRTEAAARAVRDGIA